MAVFCLWLLIYSNTHNLHFYIKTAYFHIKCIWSDVFGHIIYLISVAYCYIYH
nr:MAG TPA: hypothetical protein [Caudoviricetes sp.]